MKKLTKILSLLLSIAMVFSLMTIGVTAAGTPTAALSSPSGVLAGSEVVIDLTLTDNPGFTYLSLEYSYDKSALDLIEVNDKSLLGTYNGNGTSTLAWQNATASENFTVNGVVASLKFKVKDSTAKGEYPITLKFDADNTMDVNYDPVVFEVANGKITVIEETNITSITKETVSVPYGATAEELVAALPKTVKGQGQTTGGTAVTDLELQVESWDTTSLNLTPEDMSAQKAQTITATLKAQAGVNIDTAAKAEADVTIAPMTSGVAVVDKQVTFPKEEAARVVPEDEIKAAVVEQFGGKVELAKVADGEVLDSFTFEAKDVTIAGTLDAGVLTDGATNKAVATVTMTGKSDLGKFELTGVTASIDVVVVPAEIKDENLSFEIKPQNLTNNVSLSVAVKDANEAYAGKNVSVVVSAGDKSVTLPKEGGEAMTLAGKSSTFRLGKLSDIFGTDIAVGTEVTFEVKLDGAAIINPDGTSSVSASVRKASSSTGGSGIPNNPGSSTGESKTYNITTTESENGTFTVQSTAKAGDVVTITTKPDEGYKTDVITVKTTNNTDVKVDGKKFTMPSSDVTVSVTFVEGVEEPEPSGDFTDVPSGNWAYEAIMNLKNLGIVNGVTETTFNPDGDVTRAEFAKMVAQLFSLKATSATSAFTDCTADDWYTPYVIAVAEAGYVKGMDDSYFGADEKITRQDICTVLGRVLDAKAGEGAALNFTDADQIADYAQEYVLALVDMGVLKGYEDGTFLPAANATRAEAAKIIDGVTKLDNQVVKDAMAKLNGTDANADDNKDAADGENADDNKDANTDDNKDVADGENADDNKDAE